LRNLFSKKDFGVFSQVQFQKHAKVNTKNLHSIVQERILLQNTAQENFLQLKNIFCNNKFCALLMSVAGEAQVAIVHKNRFIAAVLRLILVKLDRMLLAPCVCVFLSWVQFYEMQLAKKLAPTTMVKHLFVFFSCHTSSSSSSSSSRAQPSFVLPCILACCDLTLSSGHISQ
jgi:hypothetical protein